jgi:phenylacetic acid degradation operon negative regulatory protein
MKMKAKILAEEVLTFMLYGLDLFLMPTFRNWDASYEEWLSRNGLLRRAHWLEKQKWLERQNADNPRAYRLTELGRRRVYGGRNPEEHWQRSWDGQWRQVIFDLPVGEKKVRAALIRWFRRNGFGYLQDSVWISPHPVGELAEALKNFREDVEYLTVLESRCAKGFSDAAMVMGAWPFANIADGYRSYQQFAQEARWRLERSRLHPRELFLLLRNERARWLSVFEPDPLLPRALWPEGYEGPRAWKARQDLLRLASQNPK